MSLLNAALAQEIVNRTMAIIGSNVNVIDASGTVIGSGDTERLGKQHEGALLVLSQQRTVEIDDAMAQQLHGVRPGVNLPLRLAGQIVGVVGITGQPDTVRHYGELVRMTAEMSLEQARLIQALGRDTRYREELVLQLIKGEAAPHSDLEAWAQKLGVDIQRPRVVAVIEVDSGTLGIDAALAELQELQTLLSTPERDNLVATVSLTELVVLKPALDHQGRWNPEEHRLRVHDLLTRVASKSRLGVRIALGQYFSAANAVALSYQSAVTTLKIGKTRKPEQTCFFYQDLSLPVLLAGLNSGWQAAQLRIPLKKLECQDGNGQLRKTLAAWFSCDTRPVETAQFLHIHRNTLDYRLSRIEAITGLTLSKTDERFLLYAALQIA
ncbi:sugar diacid recognition domain-containing protein [Iodobacter fluviatilis]|uniref:CdaR family transcriptional regulator n=1 Tax=Iodobacter fluviatilis TaxID=537 RepID=A0A377SX96_9NEIS|nr:sugar diacid recognition domain-containing protein [Iodobacter fluviatilis]TCU82234.1 CdaR family transcriptional regulator [Iodobacter fluviatilis]STR45129.1 Sugar diacid regulator [Iodobacter fluviatilis]